MASHGIEVPITKEVLQWAIQESGFELNEIADAAEVDIDRLMRWISGDELPTRTYFERLATKLKRPTALFLLPRRPIRRHRPIAFRHPRHVPRKELNPAEKRNLRLAHRLQAHLAWALGEIGAPEIELPSAHIDDDAEALGERVSQWLDLENARQAPNNDAAFTRRRELVQEKGVPVCVLSIGRDSTQGFALWDSRAPLIVINSTGWNGASRSFSLLHEIGHLALRDDSACYQTAGRRREYSRDGELETWCDRVAAAALLPWHAVEQFLDARLGIGSRAKLTSLEDASQVANRFRVSLRSTVLRLIRRQRADWDLWDQIPPVSDFRTAAGGGGMNRAQRRLSEIGKRATHTLIDAERRGVLTRSNVRDVLKLGDRDIDSIAASVAPQ